MFTKISALWRLFKKGEEVANPAAWKNGAITVNNIVLLISAILGVTSAFGYDLTLSESQINTLAVAVIAVFSAFNVVMQVITSKKVGLPNKAQSDELPNVDNVNVL